MRLREKQQTPEWQSAFRGFAGEMAKEGLKLSEKSVSAMTKAELHSSRKDLRAGIDALAKRASKLIEENPGDKWTRDISAKVDAIHSLIDVGADLTNEINDQFDRLGILDAHIEEAERLFGGKGSDRVPVLAPSDSFASATAIHGSAPEPSNRVGLAECVRGMVGMATRPEVKNALSEGTDSAGGFTVPTYLLGRLIDRLRARTVVIKAGALTVPLETQKTSIARLATDPLAAWRAENAAVGGTDPTFEKITFTAQSLACMIKVSRELLEDSINLDSALADAITSSMALELDRVALFGSGTPPEPQGVFGLGTINSVSMGTNGAQITNYAKLLDSMYELELDNNGVPSAFIMHPRTSRTIRGLLDTTNQPLIPPPALADVPQLVTTQVPITQVQGTSGAVCSTIISGDFSQLMIGIRSEMRLQLLTERFADNLQVAFLVYMRADVQVAHPESFCKLIGILP